MGVRKQPDAALVVGQHDPSSGKKFFQRRSSRHPDPARHEYPASAVKRSPLGLDLYLWLTYRTFALTRPVAAHLADSSIGSSAWTRPRLDDGRTPLNNFRKDCLRELKKINRAWPDLHYADGQGRARAVAVAASASRRHNSVPHRVGSCPP